MSVTITEVGMRDGFQFEPKLIPTEKKLATLSALLDAGVRRLQVTSFVHPKWVPQMADAEELCAQLPDGDGLTFTGLALNLKGVERAHNAGLTHVDLSISTNDQHSRDNANLTREEAVEQALMMLDAAGQFGLQAQMGLQCVFGYKSPGDTPLERILELARTFSEYPLESFSLADSTGMANPHHIQQVIRAVQEMLPNTPLVLHLHDTRGLGLANVVAALECGVSHFDASLGGLGGCPFIPGATGNIATEDVVYMLDGMGIDTGISWPGVAEIARDISAFLDKPLSGKLHRLPL